MRLNEPEKDPPKLLGIDLGARGSPSSFGQGLQVLVDSQYRGKHILQGADYLKRFYPITRETRQRPLGTLRKEPHHAESPRRNCPKPCEGSKGRLDIVIAKASKLQSLKQISIFKGHRPMKGKSWT
eukprot:Gb_12719 [translate_table: standard]